jgi:SAM-dependent methyltransferase
MNCRDGELYVGSELALFATARNWKRYVASQLGKFIGGRVLDVGAGLGSNVSYLHHSAVREWTCLEPDPEMARDLATRIERGELPIGCRAILGDIGAVPREPALDTILYLDVLEHIEDDSAELRRAAERLSGEGFLIVLAPAHPFLFSPFDAAIGHYRRYTRASLLAAAPPELRLRSCRMLDSVGFFASLANRLVLRSDMPTRREIEIWDRLMVPLSRALDPATGFHFGKSIAAVWSPIGTGKSSAA